SGSSTRIGYLITPDRTAIYRPAQPTDNRLLPVLATPHVAAEAGPHGVIPLSIEGEQIAARIVGTLRRFPSIDGDAVVANLQTAETLLETRSPGLGLTDELWTNAPPPAGANQLTVTSRADTLARLQADPLARGALLTLAGTAAVALLLALVGLLLSVVGDVRDERGELFDLEAQGAAPATIRAHLRLRALLVAAFGILGGLALGAILTSLVISLVAVTASAAEPEPPLRLALDLPILAIAAAAYIVVAAALVAFATRSRGHARRRRRHERDRAQGRVPRALDAGRRRRCAAGAQPPREGRRSADRARAERFGQVDVATSARRARAAVGGRSARVRRGRRQASRPSSRALPVDDA